MRHRKKIKKLGRKKKQRKALFKSLANQLLKHEKIKTTESRAKELRPQIEKLITKAKKNDLSSRRYLARFLKKNIVKKLAEEIAPRYKDRAGGYTRITKAKKRKGDASETAIIELV
jgi:large subunit ribosomal protein L17